MKFVQVLFFIYFSLMFIVGIHHRQYLQIKKKLRAVNNKSKAKADAEVKGRATKIKRKEKKMCSKHVIKPQYKSVLLFVFIANFVAIILNVNISHYLIRSLIHVLVFGLALSRYQGKCCCI